MWEMFIYEGGKLATHDKMRYVNDFFGENAEERREKAARQAFETEVYNASDEVTRVSLTLYGQVMDEFTR